MPPNSIESRGKNEEQNKVQSELNQSTEDGHCSKCCSHQQQQFKTLFQGVKEERDACGVGFLVDMNGVPSGHLLRAAETMSARMEHRGACSCDNLTGDGAGVMTSIPHELYADRLATEAGVTLPPPGSYATGLIFLDQSPSSAMSLFERMSRQVGLKVLAWSSPPTNDECLGSVARNSEPLIKQVFLVEATDADDAVDQEESIKVSSGLDFEQKIFFLRKWSTHEILARGIRFYICSLSSALIVYKGQFTPPQLWSFYPDLQDARFKCYLALVHARFSTNTFPSWDRAQPLRMLAHNGEINTLRGNVNLMRAREGVMTSPVYGSVLSKLYPVVEPDSSDSGSLDNVLEFLYRAGSDRSLPESVITMVPEAFTPVTREGGVSRRPSAVFSAEGPGAAAAGDGTLHPPPGTGVDPTASELPSPTGDNAQQQLQAQSPPPPPFQPLTNEQSSEKSSNVLDPDFKEQLKFEDEKRSFFQWASTSMEAWDGPALLTFSDGRYVGAILDRNGLRPSRYVQTRSGIVAMASEVGVTDFLDSEVIHKGRLKPGRMLLVDTVSKCLARDTSLKQDIFQKRPFKEWLKESLLFLPDLIGSSSRGASGSSRRFKHADRAAKREEEGSILTNVLRTKELEMGDDKENKQQPAIDPRLTLFGWSQETVDILIAPMVAKGTKKEALGSMGNDAALACVSLCQPLLYDYFKQVFAQVTNPPIDPFREKIVMSLACPVGPEANLLVPSRQQCVRLWLHQPILSNREMARLKSLAGAKSGSADPSAFLSTLNLDSGAQSGRKNAALKWRSQIISCLFPIPTGSKSLGQSLKDSLARICKEADEAANSGHVQILVLSDRILSGANDTADVNTIKEQVLNMAPIPALLALGSIHQYLITTRSRMKVALFVETGEAREIHHLCCLLGYGADAINPYMVFEAMAPRADENSRSDKQLDLDRKLHAEEVFENYCVAAETGICKVMAKMGISTLQSYKGAQIFEAVGLGPDVIEIGFKNTASRIAGADLDTIALEVVQRHALAFKLSGPDSLILRNPGYLHWRAGGERHVNEPQAVALLQEAARTNSARAYKEYVKWSRASIRSTTLRGNLALNYPPPEGAIALEQVETSCEEILKRFCTGAMSFGSISIEAHESLAKAMNKIGGKSNTGEGGEGPWRLYDAGTRSSIKQVASGRFGVTSAYLANADELQIKMAQGAKPGEGGELPGFKVTVDIAATRKSVPGVGLISPPPHHDIYSIEDLAQLIYDLKCANPRARISVKLVSVVGVGIVASGVAKGKAEHITISGHDGGTGASSWTGIKGAGLPWELGLSETHQVLVANDLRSRVTVQVDGQIRSAFDVLVAAALGADEFALSTAPLIVLGCTMMRKCHLNTCPVGVATQDPVLRAKFTGVPEHVINFFWLLAQEIREEMARLGIKRFSDLIGRTDILTFDPSNPKAAKLDFDAILCDASKLMGEGARNFQDKLAQDFALEKRKDNQLIGLLRTNGLLPQDDGTNDTDKIYYNARESERQAMITRATSERKSRDLVQELVITNVDRTFGTTVSYEVSRFWGEDGIPAKVGSLTIRARGSAGQSLGAWLVNGIKIVLEGDSNDYVGKGLSGGTIILFPPKVLTDQEHDGHLFRSENNVVAGNVCLYGATSGTALFRGIIGERSFVRNSGAFTVCEGIGDHGCEYMTGGLALILGPTGRNFGAGMSGGVAYIYCVDHQDPETVAAVEAVVEEARSSGNDDKLKGLARKLKLMTANRANLSSIDIFDSFESSEAPHLLDENTFDELSACTFDESMARARGWTDGSDAGAVAGFLNEFVSETGSRVARGILDSWNEKRHFFIKIFPKEYQKVMKDARAAESKKREREVSPPDQKKKQTTTTNDIEDMVTNGMNRQKLDKVKGFLKYKRIKGYYRDPSTRLQDWNEVYDIERIRDNARVQASRCMDCGIPFCQSNTHGCPLGNLIPAWNNLVHADEWDKSVLSLLQTNNFPEFTGRVCPAPCEGSCVLGINSDPVAIKSVELSISESGFESGLIPRTVLSATRSSAPTGQHVAIIGSGPAGLAAAAQLATAGHTVTVIERQPLPGGLLQYGIPSMKLEKRIIARRIDLMREQGINFVCGIDVGNDDNCGEWTTDRFKSNEFAAVVLAVGATWPRDLPIPGREGTDGIHFAMEFLGSERYGALRDKNARISAKGKRVIVIGGGDTGCDCIGTSLREGATSVISFEILDQPPPTRDDDSNPWPNWPKVFRTDYGHEEVKVQKLAGGSDRDPRIYNISSKEFVVARDPETGRDKVTGIRVVSVRWIQGPNPGQWKMEEVAGSEQVFEADLVLLALGFLGPEAYLAQKFGLELDPRTKVIVTPVIDTKGAVVNGATAAGAGINYHVGGKMFTCGDCRRGQSLVVHAINEGRQAARAVDSWLSGCRGSEDEQQQQQSALSVSGGLVLAPTV